MSSIVKIMMLTEALLYQSMSHYTTQKPLNESFPTNIWFYPFLSGGNFYSMIFFPGETWINLSSLLVNHWKHIEEMVLPMTSVLKKINVFTVII